MLKDKFEFDIPDDVSQSNSRKTSDNSSSNNFGIFFNKSNIQKTASVKLLGGMAFNSKKPNTNTGTSIDTTIISD